MHKTYIHIALTLLLGCLLPLHSTPRLTVVVLVDGLRTDNLTMMQPYWQAGGLRTLTEHAHRTSVILEQEVYGGAETVATLLTGETPAIHGIPADSYFSRADRNIHPVLEDENETGIGCQRKISPRRLLVPSLTDKFRITYGEKARVFAIGQDPETTIIMAGHSADGCCWWDGQTRQWATTSFYKKGLPAAADEANISGRIEETTAGEWQPRMDIRMYVNPTAQETKSGFSYKLDKHLERSPWINKLTIELALAMQKKEQLGEDSTPDMLLIQLTSRSPKSTGDKICSAEQEDMYLALNQDIGFLMEQLDKRIGESNMQIVVMGVPRLGMSKESMEKTGMPVHSFNVDRAAALTGAYLMAIYGHERWVDGGFGQSIFLNRLLIEQKKMPIETIRQQVADFLLDFEGVRVAHTLHEAYSDDRLARSMNKLSAGDVVFMLQPGWQLTFGDNTIIDNVIDERADIPVFIMSGKHNTLPDKQITPQEFIYLITKN